MTTFKDRSDVFADLGTKLTIAEIFETLVDGEVPIRFTAYDGSATGPADSEYTLNIETPRGINYLATAPGDLGMARAYISGDMTATGVHPGDPYPILAAMDSLKFRRPSALALLTIARSLGWERLRPVPPPPQETVPRWRRIALEGLRHSKTRDAEAIHHHYDVSNAFYEHVLGPSMTYTCACYGEQDWTLEQAQENKYRLVFEKLRLKEGDRLLDIGCGWGGMVRYAARRGVKVIGATLSAEQAEWAQKKIAEEGLSDLAEVRHSDYRDIAETGFDALSSIGLTEHIGVHNYPAYFGFIKSKLREGGLFLNHCITRPDNTRTTKAGDFIDRYVFPDGELIGSGRIISEIQNIGLEVMHEENLREHYALTLAEWCKNLVENWDACVAEAGEGTAKVWGLYMAGSRLGFQRNVVQLHQVLGVKLGADGRTTLPLRPWWQP
ncbi:methyltransferase domain-containing protein [Nocardia cyriacigeorgica]|uniref:Methyltransferase domain-containing protein n=1 Tax=Nocardia cyriacigeorgica TaxID=135487 RepID=A0A6P1DAG4_9NOCA|nr:class I SAM-dependent methyltransferase [Nocardia cyriacigeorgica]NEW42619.1 methyltransferase domain-containing protein [Nocardia cyriacigeorgica]NEW47706.1 methyltransferase domain-containing protein [Nocardia cyriacigeorgica]NEW53724.1 methyltransferase domain-containing protein [Nocardia cyriacigeorgica]NEW59178.1 methyltransferase domain-containing protein [Nocardia cyriacigeorgica]